MAFVRLIGFLIYIVNPETSKFLENINGTNKDNGSQKLLMQGSKISSKISP